MEIQTSSICLTSLDYLIRNDSILTRLLKKKKSTHEINEVNLFIRQKKKKKNLQFVEITTCTNILEHIVSG